MSCKDAMISKDQLIVSSPNVVTSDVISRIKDNDYNFAIIIDEKGGYLGRVSARTIIKRLLPKVATLKGVLGHLDFVKGAEPGFAEDLLKLKKGEVGEVIRSDVETVGLDTPAIEGMRILVEFGSPIAVIDKETNEFFGVITESSLLKRLSHSAKDLEDQFRQETKG